VPGVEAAATVRIVPAGGNSWNESIGVDDTSVARETANFNRVSPGYFATMGTPILAGRDFDERDRRRRRAGRDRHREVRAPVPPRREPDRRVLRLDAERTDGCRVIGSSGS
jgi:hypothetical protein